MISNVSMKLQGREVMKYMLEKKNSLRKFERRDEAYAKEKKTWSIQKERKKKR